MPCCPNEWAPWMVTVDCVAVRDVHQTSWGRVINDRIIPAFAGLASSAANVRLRPAVTGHYNRGAQSKVVRKQWTPQSNRTMRACMAVVGEKSVHGDWIRDIA